MSQPLIEERLGGVSVDLDPPVDLFQRVEQRVRRRRRRNVAAMSAASVLAVAFGTFAAGLQHPGARNDSTQDQDPASRRPPTSNTSESPEYPGGQRVITLSPPLTTILTADQVLQLGERPAGATAVSVTTWCLKPGSIEGAIPDASALGPTDPSGFSAECSAAGVEAADSRQAASVYTLPAGQDTLNLTVTAGSEWKVVTSYVSTATAPWATNARGQTYGESSNENGYPDLIPVAATNGALGYAVAYQLEDPWSPAGRKSAAGHRAVLPVYEQDGVTVIGHFVIPACHGADCFHPTGPDLWLRRQARLAEERASASAAP